MQALDILTLSLVWADLHYTEGLYAANAKGSGGGTLANLTVLRSITDTVRHVHDYCAQLGFASCRRAARISEKLIQSTERLDYSTIISELRHLSHALLSELNELAYLEVPAAKKSYLDRENLFGEEVSAAFPSAIDDIRAAGNCLAVDLCTAAVFHLMRIAEYGLRSLARKLRVKLAHRGHLHPIEFADWNKVIDGVKAELSKASKLAPGPKRQAKLELYSDASDHCLFMKDIWRNTVSHARKQYSEPEAHAAFTRVRDFMVFLARNL